MTTYQGGKKRLGKKIYEVILYVETRLAPNLQGKHQKLPYFEPFVGMGGVLRHFGKEKDPPRKIYACDINTDLILMWRAIQKGWKPPLKCSRKKFERLKSTNEHSAERGYLGVVASWSGIFFASYRLGYTEPERDNRKREGGSKETQQNRKQKDFLMEGYRGIMDIKPDIMNVKFLDSRPYYDFQPRGMLIYCDPPYYNNSFNTEYFSNFDHELFWEIMREWSKNNIVIISESTAPRDFKKIWSFTSTFTTATPQGRKTKKFVESLFIHSSLFQKL